MPYKDYLKSTHWKNKRQEKLSDVEWCQVCGSTDNLQVHHKRYGYSDTHQLVKSGKIESGSILGKERVSHLLVLCPSCHRLTHHYFKGKIGKQKRRQIRKMLNNGVVKNRAFWIASDPNLMLSMYNTAAGI